MITGLLTEHVFALQPGEIPQGEAYEGQESVTGTGGKDEEEDLSGQEAFDSGMLMEVDETEDCRIILEAGENGFFTEESGERSSTIVVTGIKGQPFSQILPGLPVPESTGNVFFAGWRLCETETFPGEEETFSGDPYSTEDTASEVTDPGETILEQDCTLRAVWEESASGDDQPSPEDNPEEEQFISGDEAEDGQSITEEGTEDGPSRTEEGSEGNLPQQEEDSGENNPEVQDPETVDPEPGEELQDPETVDPEPGEEPQDPETVDPEPGEEVQDPETVDPEPGEELRETEPDVPEKMPEQAQTGETLTGDEPAAADGPQEGQTAAAAQEKETNIPAGSAEDLEEEAVSEEAANAIGSKLTPQEGTDDQKDSVKGAPEVNSLIRKKIQKARITLSRKSFVYTGKACIPRVTVVYGNTTLEKNRDYKISFSGNISAGTATVTITGIEKFEGTVKRTFTITKAVQKLTVKTSASRVSVGSKMTVKAGGAKETKKYSFKTSNKAVAKISSTGKITGVKVGTAKIRVSTPATKNYKASSKTITVKVVPKVVKSLTAKNRTGGIKLTWSKAAGANGYYLYRNGKKIKTINSGSTVTWLDKTANKNGVNYSYKIIAKAWTGTSTLSKSVSIRRRITVKASNATTARYCLEQKKVKSTLEKSGKNHLAVIDPDGINTSLIAKAKSRGVEVYGYINAGALENSRKYYNEFKHLCICEYDGWEGEYWVDVTASSWKDHLIDEAKKQKAAGVTGVYFDNVEIYYMVRHGFDGEELYRDPPSYNSVYKALSEVIKKIENEVGILVMPNCGDTFVRRFEKENPGVIMEVNVEGVLYEDFKKTSHDDEKYLTDYLNWCARRGMVTRGIEYTTSSSEAEKAKEYYKEHGWTSVYISRHKELYGD